MSKMIRILQATVSNDGGGLTGYICHNYRAINREKIQFDFLTNEDELDFRDEFESMGAKLYNVPRPNHFYEYYKWLKRIRQERMHKAIHIHTSYANFVPILAAKLAGYQRIIVHSHSTGLDTPSKAVRYIKTIIHHAGKMLMPYLATDYCACSKLAAKWMFPENIIKQNKYEVLHNAIDLQKFRYNQVKRQELRYKLGIEDDVFVVGHVGRFSYQKNHEFLIKIFCEIEKQEPRCVLLLVGDGPDYEKVRAQVNTYDLDDKVKFLGKRSDVADLYQAMDVMVIPSHFEGLCIVAIEAQMAALPIICSEVLSDETFVSSDSEKISLKKSPKVWAEEALEKKGIERKDNTDILRKAGYDAVTEIKRVEQLYLEN